VSRTESSKLMNCSKICGRKAELVSIWVTVENFQALGSASGLEEARTHLDALSMDFGSLFHPLSRFPNATPVWLPFPVTSRLT
jgi:hypothetical protein